MTRDGFVPGDGWLLVGGIASSVHPGGAGRHWNPSARAGAGRASTTAAAAIARITAASGSLRPEPMHAPTDYPSAVKRLVWSLPGQELDCAARTLVMGVLNVTPDSFSDGGRFFDPEAAVRHGLDMASDGADVLDVGGESTRPGSDPVPAAEERDRVGPGMKRLVAELPDVRGPIDTPRAAQ